MRLKSAILLFFLSLIALNVKSQVLDQKQLTFNESISGRSLDGYNLFQSFTAGITGTLTQIDIGVIDSAVARLKIYSGIDTTGVLLYTTSPVEVFCPTCYIPFMVSVPVVAGQTYTFRYMHAPGNQDPYFLQGARPGTYPGGKMGFINPFVMGYPPLDPDLVFRTYVLPITGIDNASRHSFSFDVFPNPSDELVTVRWENMKVNELVVTNVLGKMVKKMSVSGDEKSMEIHDLQSGVYFILLKDTEQGTSAARRILIQ